jgi:hypothetical protein
MTIKNVNAALKTANRGDLNVMTMILESRYPGGNITKNELKQFLTRNSIHGETWYDMVCGLFKQYHLK